MKSIHSFMKCGKKKIYSSESFARKKLRCLENKILDDISLEQKSNILEEMAELFLSLEEYYFANVAIQRALEYSEKSATSAKCYIGQLFLFSQILFAEKRYCEAINVFVLSTELLSKY